MSFGIERVRHSLRNRLLVFLSISLALLLLVTSGTVFVTSEQEMNEILDGQMVTMGRALFAVVALELDQGNEDGLTEVLDRYVRQRRAAGDWIGEHPTQDIYDSSFYVQLTRGDGTIVFTSRLPPVLFGEADRTGFFRLSRDGEEWRLFGLQDPRTDYYFHIGQTTEVRQELSEESTRHLVMPFLTGGLLILAAVWFGTRYALRPLENLGARIDARAPDDTSLIDAGQELVEFRPLINALNSLFLRIRRMVANERRFNADASHELRTPLAGITANLDAARSFDADPGQAAFLDNIATCVTNATSVTEGLLLFSRLESETNREHFQDDDIDLGRLVDEEIARYRVSHPEVAGRLSVEYTRGDNFALRVPSVLVSTLLRNLVENALRHGGAGPVHVTVTRHPGAVLELAVLDTGPGIPEEALESVFERFRQLAPGGAGGSGLGLSIARKIADHLGAGLVLSNRPGGGLQASVTFNGSQSAPG